MITPSTRPGLSSTKSLLLAAAMLSPVAAFAGLLRTDIDVQTYRDFAENRSVFKAGATNVTIYNSDGSVNGVVAVMPDFSSVVDYGSATIVSPSFAGSVAHVGTQPQSRHTYGNRFNSTGLDYSLFGEAYKQISNLTPGNDVQLFRYSKMVIEAAPATLVTDNAIITGMTGNNIVRVGGGKQSLAITPGVVAPADPITGTNGWLTGGFNRIDSQNTYSGTDNVNDGVTKSYSTYTYVLNMDAVAQAPLQIGTQVGDSGSPLFTWNSTTGQYELLAFNSAGGGDGVGAASYVVASPLWMVDMMDSYRSPTVMDSSGGGVITMSATDTSGAGTFTQGASTWNYIGLADGLTSAAATNAQLDATRNLRFSGAGNIIRLAGSVDMGAATMEFTGGGTYTLDDNGVTTHRLNTAGYIVDAGTTLVSKLTASAGDDWRKVGTGTLRIEGSGNNAAKLSLGEGLVELNRTGGYAVNDVLITSGRGTVRLLQANQIGGTVAFGHRGGTLDLYGTSLSRPVIYAMDDGARIANTKANTTSTLTWTGSGSGLEQTFRGGFTDGGSLANGLLNVVIAPTTPSGSVLTLLGNSSNAGGYAINGGEVVLRGYNTLHAGSGAGEGATLRPVPTPDDWTYASISTGTITVGNGARFTLADHAALNGSVTVNAGGTFAITENLFKSTAEAVDVAAYGTPSAALYGHQSGAVNLNGSSAAMIATVSGATDQTVVYSRNITGTGSFTKNGSGTLTLSGSNTFSGVKTLNEGTLIGTSLAALGDTTTNKWAVGNSTVIAATGATAANLKAKLTTTSTGTLALAGTNPDAAPNLTGYANLFLGAIGAQTVGASNTSTNLTKWAGGNTGWNLGGGGGNLTMNLKLSGTGTLNVGNGYNTGTVTLTNAKNNSTTGGARFTGAIVVNAGATLLNTSTSALGQIGSADRFTVNYGGRFALGAGAGATTVFGSVTSGSAGVLGITGTDTNAYSFSAQGLHSAALGAIGTATYSGTLTPGTGGYRFGGDGALTVASVLSGTRAVSADGQGSTGGVTTLSGANTFTGAVTVQGGTINGILGSHTLRAGSNTAFGSGNALTLNDGGALDLDAHTIATGNLTGSAASSLTNSSASAATITINQTADTTMAGVLSGTGGLNLVKNGAGSLTLAGANTHSGTTTISAGTLRIGDGGTSGALGSGNVVNNASLIFDRSDALSASNSISGSGSLTHAGAGALTLSGNNTYTGGTTIAQGRLNASVAALGTGAITVGAAADYGSSYASGGTPFLNITDTGSTTLANAIALPSTGATGYYAIQKTGQGSSLTLSGVISGGGAGAVLQLDTPNGGDSETRFTLTGNNTFAGQLRLNRGTVTLANANAAGTADIWLQSNSNADGNLIFSNSFTLANAIRIATGNNNISTGAHDVTLTGSLTSSVAWQKVNGSGTLTLAADNAITNTLTIAEGTLRIGAGGTTGSLGGTADIVNNAALVFDRSDAHTVSNLISGAGSVTHTGSGTLTLSGANTYAGVTTIESGTVKIGHKNAFGAFQSGRPVTQVVVNSGGAVDFNGVGDATYGYTIAGTGVGGSGALVNSGAAIGNGTAQLSNIRLAADATIGGTGDFALLTNAYGATSLDLAGYTLTKSGTNTFTLVNTTLTAGTLRVAQGVLSASGVVGDAATVTMDNTAGVSLNLGQNASLGALSGGGASGGGVNLGSSTLTVGARNTTTTYAGTISGTGALNKTGTGTLTLTGVNTHTGGTTVSSGTLQLGDNAATDYGSTGRIRGTLTANAGTTVLLNGTNTLGWSTGAKVDAVNLNGATLTHAGNGDSGWGVAYTLSGATMQTTSAGRFAFGGPSGANTSVTTLASATTSTIAGTVNLRADGGNSAVVFSVADGAASTDLLVSANIAQQAGTVGIIKNGAGTMALTGMNTFAGGITVNQGRLNANAASLGTGTITAGTAAIFGGSYASGGTPFLQITDTGDATVSNAIAIMNPASTGYFAIQKLGTGSNLTLTGTISGGGANTILQLDSPTGGDSTTNFTLAGNNTIAGQIRLNRGYVTLTNANAAGTASIFLQSNANSSGNLRFSNSFTLNNAVVFGTTNNNTISTGGNNVTIAGVVSGSAAWTKTGAGNLTLSGNNTYTGVTTVNAGRLIAGSNSAFGTGGVVAASGGTVSVGLPGAGRTIANAITVASGGALAGTASLSGGVTLAAGAAYVWSIVNSAPTVAGTDFDRLVITAGTFTLNANSVLKIDASGVDYSTAFWDSGHTFSFVTKSGTGAISGAFSSLDTSSAGLFDSRGSWSVTSDSSGLSAVWTAGEALQGMSMQTTSTQAVPEPATYGLLGAGALALVAAVRRRRRVIA